MGLFLSWHCCMPHAYIPTVCKSHRQLQDEGYHLEINAMCGLLNLAGRVAHQACLHVQVLRTADQRR